MSAGTAGRGQFRASHPDREQVIELLKEAFVQGRLAKDELDLRVDQVFAARSHAELAAVTADLYAGPTTSPATAIRTAVSAGRWHLEMAGCQHGFSLPSLARRRFTAGGSAAHPGLGCGRRTRTA
jgi:uncharacterized protein DUF1707